MARIRRPPVQRRTAVANYLVTRADEEKRRHPEKSYSQIGRELGIRQKDPARLIRKLRSGETSGRLIVPELLGRPTRRVPIPQRLRGRFVVAYEWWPTADPDTRSWARTNVVIEGYSPLDIFRLRDDPRIDAAVKRDIARKAARRARMADGSGPVSIDVDYEIDEVYSERTQRAEPIIIYSYAS